MLADRPVLVSALYPTFMAFEDTSTVVVGSKFIRMDRNRLNYCIRPNCAGPAIAGYCYINCISTKIRNLFS